MPDDEQQPNEPAPPAEPPTPPADPAAAPAPAAVPAVPGRAMRAPDEPPPELQEAFAEAIQRLRQRTGDNPEDIAEAFAGVFTHQVREERRFFQGPHPSPEMIVRYEDAIPGLGMLLVQRGNIEQDFRHEMARREQEESRACLTYVATKTYVGQACAFVLGITGIGGGIYLLANDKAVGGLVSVIFTLVSLVGAFIAGQYWQQTPSDESDSDDDDDDDE